MVVTCRGKCKCVKTAPISCKHYAMLKIVTESKCLIISNIIDVKLTFMTITPVYDAKCIFILDFKDFPNGRH